MSSQETLWPAGVPDDVAAHLSAVRDHAVRFCMEPLSLFAEFHPFAVSLAADRRILARGGQFIPDSVPDPIAWLYESFVGYAEEGYLALAIVHDVGGDESPFVRIYCEHRVGLAFRVSIPWYRRVDDNVRFRLPIVEPTEAQIWTGVQ